MDKLLACAKSFEKLFDINYHIIIGRKGKTVDLKIGFEPLDFHHLIGIHKLKDLRISRASREDVFKSVLSGEIPLSHIMVSRYYGNIHNRIEPFTDIEQIFDANRLVFRYNEKQQKYSIIEAEYLLSTPYINTDIYFFIDKREGTDIYFCRSFFPKGQREYTAGQTVYTMLFKEKITISTGEKQVQYDRLSPLEKDY
ncbi:MAG: PBECR4 domain-containing protein [Clostridiales bacterium]|nr:PBECR4 domain-containing protein [Clostridiales bacterium]